MVNYDFTEWKPIRMVNVRTWKLADPKLRSAVIKEQLKTSESSEGSVQT